MKLNFKAAFAVLLGLVTARLVFHLAGWSHNSFRDPFDSWKLVAGYGVPVAATLIWYWILQVTYRSRSE